MKFIVSLLLTVFINWSHNDYIVIDTIEFKVVKKVNQIENIFGSMAMNRQLEWHWSII